MTSVWSAADLLPGVYLLVLSGLLALALRRWYDGVPGRVLLLFALILAALFGPELFAGKVLLPLDVVRFRPPFESLPPAETPSVGLQRDLVQQIAPWVLEVKRLIAAGRWPLWNEHEGAGMPLMADPQAQAFQPLVLLGYPFSVWQAAGITAALRVLLALVFTFLLLRRLGTGAAAAAAGAACFALGGFSMLWLGWPIANATALLPVALYAIVRCDEVGRRRDHLLLGLASATLLLAGHPETAVYCAAFAGLFLLARCLGRRRARRPGATSLLLRCSAAMALGGLAAAPPLWLAGSYLPTTQRAAVVRSVLSPRPLASLWHDLVQPVGLATWGRWASLRLLPVAAPFVFGDQRTGYWGETNFIQDTGAFAGSLALVLAVAALLPGRRGGRRPQERLFLLVLLGGLALLAQPPGFNRLAGALPVLGPTAIHRHARVQVLVCFCLAGLAAFEADRWAVERRAGRWRRLIATLAVAALAGWAYLAHPIPGLPESYGDFRRSWCWLQLAIVGSGGLLLLAGAGRRWAAWGLSGLAVVELLAIYRPANPPAPPRLAWPVVPAVRFLQTHLGSDRLAGAGLAFPANFAAVFGLSDVRIDNPSLPESYSRATHLVDRGGVIPLFGRFTHPLYDLLGVRYVITRPGAELPLPRVFGDNTAWIYQRQDPLPRLFLPPRAVAAGSDDWPAWLEDNPDFGFRALVEPSDEMWRRWRAENPEQSEVRIERLEADRVSAHARLAESRLLASGIYQDGGWRLLAGGRPVATLLVDGTFAGAWLPPGDWQLELLYRPAGFVASCLLTALALAAAAAWWVRPPGCGRMHPRPA